MPNFQMMPLPAPPGAFPQPLRAAAPLAWQTPPAPRTAPAPSMPVNAAMAMDQAPRPIFRGQAPEAPPTSAGPITLPSPESLGLTTAPTPPAAPAPAIDWNDIRARLRQLGAVGF